LAIERERKTMDNRRKRLPEDEYWFREMDRMLNDFWRRFETSYGGSRGGSWWPSTSTMFEPRGVGSLLPDITTRPTFADLVDTGNEYRVSVEVPGILKENLDITVTNKGITIEGKAKSSVEQQEESKGFVWRERGYSKIRRSLEFPEEVIPDKAEATLENGVLEVNVPKKVPTEIKSQKIQVK
jgi:HSP20 family protein